MSYEIKAGVTRKVTMTSSLGPVTYSAVDSANNPSAILHADPSSGVVSVVGSPSSQADAYVTGTAGGSLLDTVTFTVLAGDSPISDSSPATVEVGPPVTAPTFSVDNLTPGVLFVTWSGVDITSPVPVPAGSTLSGANPSELLLWDETTNQQMGNLTFASSGTGQVSTAGYESTNIKVGIRTSALTFGF
jgi:hypothetical protein